MPGKLVVHGFNEMVVGGTVDILLNDEKVGSVERGETAEFPIQKDSHLVVKCGINPLKAKLDIQNGMRTEIQCKYNRLTGAVQAQIVSVTPYEGTQEEFSGEQPLRVFDGGLKDVLYMDVRRDGTVYVSPSSTPCYTRKLHLREGGWA